MKKILRTAMEYLWKGFIVGIVTLVSLMISAGILTELGAKFPNVNNNPNYMLAAMFGSGFIISVFGGLIRKNLGGGKLRAFVIIFVALVSNMVTQIL